MATSIRYSLPAVLILLLGTTALAGEIGVGVVFTDGEISIIRAYYRDHTADTGGKIRKDKGLPPGIARNLQRGKTLPPGIARQALPTRLIAELPPPPRGYERIVLSGKILLVEVATQVIHDVLSDVIIGN